MWTKYIVAALLLASAVLCSPNLFIEKDISEEKYPFLVSLRVDDIHWCVGTIVAPKWVLAAAHCTNIPRNSKEFSVQYGVKTPSRYGPNVVSVKKAHVYGGWNVQEPFAHDIALFELEDRLPIDYKTVAPVNLPVKGLVGEKEVPAVFSTWTLNLNTGAFNNKVEIPLKIQTREQCGRRLSGLLSPFGNICTSVVDVGTEQQCLMFGGPLLYRGGTQLAIATFRKGHHCTIPDVYTKVSMYVPWILSTIDKYATTV